MQHTRTSSLQIISTHINEKEREMISAMIPIQWGCSNLVELCDVSLNPSKRQPLLLSMSLRISIALSLSCAKHYMCKSFSQCLIYEREASGARI
jgi:hypothetical protein